MPQHLHIPAAGEAIEIQRLEPHRTDGHAPAAADAGGVGGLQVICAGQRHDGVGALDHRRGEIRLGAAHHGSAGDDLPHIPLQAPRRLDGVGEGRPNGDDQVFRLLDPMAGDCDDPAEDGLPVRHGAAHAGAGGDVKDRAPHILGKAAGGYLAAGDGLDELLLRPLGIAGGQHHQLHLVLLFQLVRQDRDCPLLVVLNGDDRPAGLQQLPQQPQSPDRPVRVCAEQGVVRRDVGLTLAGIGDQGLHLPDIGLDVRGERGTAHAHQPGLPDAADHGVVVQCVRIGAGLDRAVVGVLKVILDRHGQAGLAAGVAPGLNGRHSAGHRGVDRDAQPLAVADLLPHVHMVPGLHQGRTGLSE